MSHHLPPQPQLKKITPNSGTKSHIPSIQSNKILLMEGGRAAVVKRFKKLMAILRFINFKTSMRDRGVLPLRPRELNLTKCCRGFSKVNKTFLYGGVGGGGWKTSNQTSYQIYIKLCGVGIFNRDIWVSSSPS